MNKTDLFYEYAQKQEEIDNWYDSIPSEISHSFYDNPAINNMSLILEKALSMIYTADELFSIHWWLYVREFVDNQTIESPVGTEISVETLDDYIDYLVKFEGWEPRTI